MLKLKTDICQGWGSTVLEASKDGEAKTKAPMGLENIQIKL
jgi:hypothetical protein